MQSLCNKLGISNSTKTEAQVIDTSESNDFFNSWQNKSVNLEEVNFLAKRLESLDSREINIFYAVSTSKNYVSLKDLINLTYNTHCYDILNDLSDFEEAGKQLHIKSLTSAGGDNSQINPDLLNGTQYIAQLIAENPSQFVLPYGFVYRVALDEPLSVLINIFSPTFHKFSH